MPELLSDENQLIAKAKRGDVEAFNMLVLRYQNYIYSITYRIMGEADGAADSAQDTFLTAYRKLTSFRGGNFKAWLARIATNTCYDELRKQKRRPQDYLEEMPGSDMYDEPPVAADIPNPEQEAQRADLNRALQDCINGLSTDQRMVLVLSDVQGFSYQEVAAQVGAELGTVKSRLSRARLAMRRCLQAVEELLPSEYRLSE
ncbi:MAG: sigma-70 family RNA polymerase sigma factor [Anaerolineae bacterium]|nr:sigma-70 family RNA polymerase sigma factor [Anaerolineae bacterium]MDQ7035057.1 sigma-70 family RNA polymerase sigma factor [Anaerolineae bacterium]